MQMAKAMGLNTIATYVFWNFGYILPRKTLSAPAHAPLILDEVHDYAQVYVDGKLAGRWIANSSRIGSISRLRQAQGSTSWSRTPAASTRRR